MKVGIPSEDGYVKFIGVVNLMVHKCMISDGTVTTVMLVCLG